MHLQADFCKHILQFRFEAGTSRGVLTQRDTWYLRLYHAEQPELVGIGESSPLSGLSIDYRPDFEAKLRKLCRLISETPLPPEAEVLTRWIGNEFPAIQFGFETALADLRNGGKKLIFPGLFYEGKQEIEINGLIWMGKADFMQRQIEEKLSQGYRCLKMKIGAIDFPTECQLLASIRERFPASLITLRVDANGAFAPEEALTKLEKLALFDLHSIEQPIKAGQWSLMQQLCRETPLPIALDEELIGVSDWTQKRELLRAIRPQYIILKPTLLGGFAHTRKWIGLAEKMGIGWWITSALESNIGLNAISQFTASLHPPLPQGLGTGQLYHNNIDSPLEINNGFLRYNPEKKWEIG